MAHVPAPRIHRDSTSYRHIAIDFTAVDCWTWSLDVVDVVLHVLECTVASTVGQQ